VVRVLHCPPRAPRRHKAGHGFPGKRLLGDKGLLREAQPLRGGDWPFTPIDLQRSGGRASGELSGVAIGIEEPPWRGVVALGDWVEGFPHFPIRQLPREGGLGVGLAPQDKGPVLLDQDLTPGRVGVEGSPHKGAAGGPRVWGRLPRPALGGGSCTILFVVPIVGPDELGRQGNHFIRAGRDNDWGQHPMRRGGGAIRGRWGRAGGTRDFLRGEILRAIQAHEPPVLPRAQRRQLGGVRSRGHAVLKEGPPQVRAHRIK
jgi:hypothetical protein